MELLDDHLWMLFYEGEGSAGEANEKSKTPGDKGGKHKKKGGMVGRDGGEGRLAEAGGGGGGPGRTGAGADAGNRKEQITHETAGEDRCYVESNHTWDEFGESSGGEGRGDAGGVGGAEAGGPRAAEDWWRCDGAGARAGSAAGESRGAE